MLKGKLLAGVAAGAFFGIWTTQSSAATVTIEFEGLVDFSSYGAVGQGDRVSGSASFDVDDTTYQEALDDGGLAYYMVLEQGAPAVAVSINDQSWTSNNQGWAVVGNNIRPPDSPDLSFDAIAVGGGSLLVTDNDQIEPISSNQIGQGSIINSDGGASIFSATGVLVRLVEQGNGGNDPNLLSAGVLPTTTDEIDYTTRPSINGSGNITSLDENGQNYSIGFTLISDEISFSGPAQDLPSAPEAQLTSASFGSAAIFGDVENFDPSKPTVVLTHGLQLQSSYTGGVGVDFLDQMNANIETDFGDDVNIIAFTWENAFVDTLSDAAGIPTLYADDAGQDLGLSLQLLFGDQYEMPIHMIGHSYGTAVNASAVEFLTDRGFVIDHFTTLDAPSNGLVPIVPIEVYADVATNPNVTYFDNYYGNGLPILSGIGGFGDQLPGAALSGGYTIEGANHTQVWEAYSDSVGNTECRVAEGGFAYSAALGTTGCFDRRPNQPLNFSTISEMAPLDLLLQENGDFNVANSTIEISTGSDGYAVFQTLIPDFANTLYFDLQFDRPGDGDWLEVIWNGNLLGAYRGINFSDIEQSLFIDITEYSGLEGNLSFLLASSGPEAASLSISNVSYLGTGLAGIAPVPLPASFWYLLLGIVILIAVPRPNQVALRPSIFKPQ